MRKNMWHLLTSKIYSIEEILIMVINTIYSKEENNNNNNIWTTYTGLINRYVYNKKVLNRKKIMSYNPVFCRKI